MNILNLLMALVLFTFTNNVSAEDSGLTDAIKHSNILQLNPKPNIKLKASLSFKEAVNCDVNPENGKLFVTMNPNAWYKLNAVDQINTFCEEMHRCDYRIKCHKL